MSLQCETDSTVEKEMPGRRIFEAQDLKLTPHGTQVVLTCLFDVIRA